MSFKKIIILLTSSILGAILASTALAAVAIPSGWYVEANGGSSLSQNPHYGDGAAPNRSGFGWNIDAGYKFMPYFAAEIGVTSYATIYIKNSTTNANAAEDRHHAYDIAGKGIFPIGDTGAELFAKAGMSRIYSHVVITDQANADSAGIAGSSNSAAGFYYSLGGAYHFAASFSANIQFSKAKGDSTTGDQNLTSAGISYNFG